MKILLTGGAGFIGSHTCVELCEAGHDPVIVDNYINSCPEAVRRIEQIVGRSVPCYEADVTDAAAMDRIFSENAFDWDRMIEHRKSSIRCKVEHPFHYLKNKFGFKKVRYRGIAKNLNKLNILFACINLIMRDYALKHSVQPTG